MPNNEVTFAPETERVHLNINKLDDTHVKVQFLWLGHEGKMINNQLQYPVNGKFSVLFHTEEQLDQVINYLEACKKILSGDINNENFSTQIKQ